MAPVARLLAGLGAPRGDHRAVQEAMAVVARLHDVAVAREPVQQRRRHLRVTEHVEPFGEAQVRRDHHAGVLVQPGGQTEQQRPAGLAEWQVAQFIEDHQVQAQQARRDAPGLALRLLLLLLLRIEQIHRRAKTARTCHGG